MPKIACVFSFRESTWISCQKIVFNLHKAYESIPGATISNFDYGLDSGSTETYLLAQDLFESDSDAIVIMDHKPHPVHLLKILLPKYEGKVKPLIVFHVFGDFTLNYVQWAKVGTLLDGFPVEFIVASDRQKHLIDKFLSPPQTSHVCPFPVKIEDFRYIPKERLEQRKAWGVSDKELVFTFTGRISRQKRIHLLLKTFDEALRREGSADSRLYIYGDADNVGDTFLNIWDNENEYFRKVYRLFLELPESTRSRIHFMGSVPNSELRSVYAGADYLVNLSVHNDEDYGMSVAEAQMSGLPAILTDWGGLASFEHPSLPAATRFLKVSIGARSKVVSISDTVEAIAHAMKTPRFNDRERLMQLATERFSVEASSQILTWIYGQKSVPFKSFSELLKKITTRMQLNQRIYMTQEMKVSNLYRKLYSSYVRNT